MPDVTLTPEEAAAGLLPRDVAGLSLTERRQFAELAARRNKLCGTFLAAMTPPDFCHDAVLARMGWTNTVIADKLAGLAVLQEALAQDRTVMAAVRERLLGTGG